MRLATLCHQFEAVFSQAGFVAHSTPIRSSVQASSFQIGAYFLDGMSTYALLKCELQHAISRSFCSVLGSHRAEMYITVVYLQHHGVGMAYRFAESEFGEAVQKSARVEAAHVHLRAVFSAQCQACEINQRINNQK